MGATLASLLGRGPPETAIKGPLPRIKNIFIQHFRGILGVLVPVALLSWQSDIKNSGATVINIWIWMACFFLFQPVTIQVTGSIPVFAFPMLGIMSTENMISAYFNEGIALFIIGGMLHLLLNNSGFDRRLILSILCMGSAKWFTPYMILLKGMLAGYVCSIFCHRLIVTSTLIQYFTPVLMDLQAATLRYRATEPEFNQIRYIVNSAIQSSCSIGGLVLIHSSFCTLIARAIYYESAFYPDIFNYLQYTMFALPISVGMLIVNFIYHALLIKFLGGKSMAAARMTALRTSMLKYKTQIPKKITTHELLTIFFALLSLAMFFSRYVKMFEGGWALFSVNNNMQLRDATVAALFVIALHILPRGYGFTKVFLAKKKSELPPTKAESAILFWRFIDKNTNYGYFFVIGAGIALFKGSDAAGPKLAEKFSFLTNLDFCVALLIISLISAILSNIVSGAAVVSIVLPLLLRLGNEQAEDSLWKTCSYRLALVVGLSCSFGFLSPFLYTPAYFYHHTGKVPRLIMLKYSLVPCILLAIVLYLGVCYYSSTIFGDSVLPSIDPGSGATTTTEAP